MGERPRVTIRQRHGEWIAACRCGDAMWSGDRRHGHWSLWPLALAWARSHVRRHYRVPALELSCPH